MVQLNVELSQPRKIQEEQANKTLVGKLLTRSTRFTCFCTAQTSIFQKNFVKLFRIFRQILQEFIIFEFFSVIVAQILMKFYRIFQKMLLGSFPNCSFKAKKQFKKMLNFSEIFEFAKEKFRKIPILKEFEWFEWFEWFGPSPIEPFNSGRRGGGA